MKMVWGQGGKRRIKGCERGMQNGKGVHKDLGEMRKRKIRGTVCPVSGLTSAVAIGNLIYMMSSWLLF